MNEVAKLFFAKIELIILKQLVVSADRIFFSYSKLLFGKDMVLTFLISLTKGILIY